MSAPAMTRPWRWALTLCALATIVPLFCARHLPMCDLPEHLAAIATIRHYWDPSWRSAEYFSLNGALETPYWLYHATAAALSVVTGSAERANLLLLSCVGLAYPLSLRALLRALGRDERLAIFGCALFWTQNLTVGLLNFVASVPVAIFGLSLVAKHVAAPTRSRGVGVALVAVALLYLHGSSFVLFCAQAAWLVATLDAPPPSPSPSTWASSRAARAARTLGWLAPAVALAGAIATAGQAGASRRGSAEILFTPRLELVRKLPVWLFDAFRSRVDDALGAAIVVALVLLLVSSPRATTDDDKRRSRAAVGLFALAAAMYFTLPAQVGSFAFLLDVRMAVFVGAFAVLLPRPRPGARTSRVFAAAAALAVGLGMNAAYEVRAFERDEVGRFDDLLRELPRGKRLLALNFQPRSTHVNAHPFAYFGSYYRARYGGIASFSFSEMPHWPVRYRPEWRPPTPLTFGDPCVFRNARDGRFYDFVLVHGETDPFASAPRGPRWEIVGSSRGFRLYRKAGDASGAGAGDDDDTADGATDASRVDAGPCG